MSQADEQHQSEHESEHDPADHSEEIAAVQEELDEESEGDGLAAESGRGEETGLSQG